MANWTLTGDLGAGKSIIAVGKIRDQLLTGRPCAGNMDVFLDHLTPLMCRTPYLRLPDFPSADDLWKLGVASDSKNEKSFGLLVLDELAVFLNSRDWKGADRDKVIKYLRHVRKQHWHTIFITQDIESIDAQARRALIEHKVVCKRSDRLNIPVIGTLAKMFGMALRLPKIHMAVVRYGKSEYSPIVDKWFYRGNNLYGSYDTDQIFTEYETRDIQLKPYDPITGKTSDKKYPAEVTGAFNMLSAWHLRGRYMSIFQRYKQNVYTALMVILAVGLLLTYIQYNQDQNKSQPGAAAESSKFDVLKLNPEKITGLLKNGNLILINTSTGVLEAQSMHEQDGKTYYRNGSKWYVYSPS